MIRAIGGERQASFDRFSLYRLPELRLFRNRPFCGKCESDNDRGSVSFLSLRSFCFNKTRAPIFFYDLTLAKSTCGGELSPKPAPRLGLVDGAGATNQRLARRAAEVNAGPASQAPLRHGNTVAARCSYLRDQPGWTTANDHKIIVAAARLAAGWRPLTHRT